MPDNPPIIAGTRIGHVHLKVADLDRALGFYCGVLGFEVMQRMGSGAAFISAGGYHHHIGLNTWESKGGHPPPPGTTGLFHTAILYPTPPGAGRCAASRDAGRHPARRRQRPRRQRGALFARSRRERRRAVSGPARRRNGRARRTDRWRCSRSGWISRICCGSGRRESHRHCEERSDDAIRTILTLATGLLRFARNDGSTRVFAPPANHDQHRRDQLQRRCSRRTAAHSCPTHRAAGRSRRGRTRR